jgi:hypothetical protein
VPVRFRRLKAPLGQVAAPALDQRGYQPIQQFLTAAVGTGVGRQEKLHGFVQPAARQGSFATF